MRRCATAGENGAALISLNCALVVRAAARSNEESNNETVGIDFTTLLRSITDAPGYITLAAHRRYRKIKMV
jgi:hypothetical protein